MLLLAVLNKCESIACLEMIRGHLSKLSVWRIGVVCACKEIRGRLSGTGLQYFKSRFGLHDSFFNNIISLCC